MIFFSGLWKFYRKVFFIVTLFLKKNVFLDIWLIFSLFVWCFILMILFVSPLSYIHGIWFCVPYRIVSDYFQLCLVTLTSHTFLISSSVSSLSLPQVFVAIVCSICTVCPPQWNPWLDFSLVFICPLDFWLHLNRD